MIKVVKGRYSNFLKILYFVIMNLSNFIYSVMLILF